MFPILELGLFQIAVLVGIPLALIQVIALLMAASLLQPGTHAMEAGKAIYCAIAQTFSAILMTIGGLPTIYAVLAGQPLHSLTYIGLLLTFTIGGILYLWHDANARSIDTVSGHIAFTVTFFMWKLAGLFVCSLAIISLSLQVIFVGSGLSPEWWSLHVVAILYGLLLLWCTRHVEEEPGFFRRFFQRKPGKTVKKKARK